MSSSGRQARLSGVLALLACATCSGGREAETARSPAAALVTASGAITGTADDLRTG
jgi:hypothetical protein